MHNLHCICGLGRGMSSLASPYRGRSSQLLPHPFRIAIPEILSYLICVIFAQMSQSVAGQKLLEHIVFFFPNLIVVEFVETCAVHIVFTFSSKSHWLEGDSWKPLCHLLGLPVPAPCSIEALKDRHHLVCLLHPVCRPTDHPSCPPPPPVPWHSDVQAHLDVIRITCNTDIPTQKYTMSPLQQFAPCPVPCLHTSLQGAEPAHRCPSFRFLQLFLG